MCVTDVVRLYIALTMCGTLKYKTVVKHLYLYFSAANRIITVAFGLTVALVYKMGMFRFGCKPSVLTEIGWLINLQFKQFNHLVYLIKNEFAFKNNVFLRISSGSISSLYLDDFMEARILARKESLRFFRTKNSSRTYPLA